MRETYNRSRLALIITDIEYAKRGTSENQLE